MSGFVYKSWSAKNLIYIDVGVFITQFRNSVIFKSALLNDGLLVTVCPVNAVIIYISFIHLTPGPLLSQGREDYLREPGGALH